MKRTFFSLVFFISSLCFLQAQNYQTGVGVRGGFSNGVTVKHFIADGKAIEGILSTRWRGFLVTGLLEFQQPTQVEGLDWYFGVGGHIGFWNSSSRNNPFSDDGTATVLGVDGILGLDYTFSDFPINVSLDWKPAFNLFGYTGFWGDGGALSIRYVF